MNNNKEEHVFKKGQTVYLRRMNDAARGREGEALIQEAQVISVGNKYITVAYDDFFVWKIQFYKDDLRQKTKYCQDFELHLSRQDILDELAKEDIAWEIRQYMRYLDDITAYSLETLIKVRDLLRDGRNQTDV